MLGSQGLLEHTEMVAIRIMAGPAVISRTFFTINEQSRLRIIARLTSHFKQRRDDKHLMGTVFEMQVACRLANAGMDFEFLKEVKGKKQPDLKVDEFDLLLECKNLAPKDFTVTHVHGMCAQMRKHARKAASQFYSVDPAKELNHLVIFHLPPDPRGFFTGKGLDAHVNLSLAASGSEDQGSSGRPGPIAALLVGSSLSKLYDRPGPFREPAEYWHHFSPLSLRNASISRFVWQLFMCMNVCPYEGYSRPILMSDSYLHNQSL